MFKFLRLQPRQLLPSGANFLQKHNEHLSLFSFRKLSFLNENKNESEKVKFEYFAPFHPIAEKYLKKYIEKGKQIRSQNDSKLLKSINDLIKYSGDSDLVQSEMKKVDIDQSDQMYIAFAAPSLTGKTQLAFTINSKLPLYFAMDMSQHVYQNFSSISKALQDFARDDFRMIRLNQEIPNDSIISATELRRSFPTTKFHTLGFLVALMEEAESKFMPQHVDWMEFYSNRSSGERKVLEFNPVSLAEFRMHPNRDTLLRKYYVFLDEFSALRENLFLRNLCRSICLTCALASTNTQITNLVGTSRRSSSRNEGGEVWASVVCQIPGFETSSSSYFSDAKAKLNVLLDLCEKNSSSSSMQEYSKMKELIDYLVNDQFHHSRPGLVFMITDSIDQFVRNLKQDDYGSFTVKSFLEYLLKDLGFKLRRRKAHAFDDYVGMHATLGLFSKHVFINDYSLRRSVKPSANFVDNHFYYLMPPHSPDEAMFVLFHSLDFLSPTIHMDRKKISIQYEEFETYSVFKEQESFLLLACMLAPRSASTSGIIHKNLKSSIVPNYRELSAKGDVLEIESMTAIVDSSHYTVNEPEGTFSGVVGDEFIAQVVDNLKVNTRRVNPNNLKFPLSISLLFSDPLIEEQIKSIKVPFLYSSDMEWPRVYSQIFPCCEGPGHIGNYKRMSKEDQIDGIFDVLKWDDAAATWKSSKAIVKAKNYSVRLRPSEFFEIIEKAKKSKYKGFFHLLIVSKGPVFKQTKDLKDFLQNNPSINFFRLVPSKKEVSTPTTTSDIEEFTIEPISKQMPINTNPDMIFLIIETDLINNARSP